MSYMATFGQKEQWIPWLIIPPPRYRHTEFKPGLHELAPDRRDTFPRGKSPSWINEDKSSILYCFILEYFQPYLILR